MSDQSFDMEEDEAARELLEEVEYGGRHAGMARWLKPLVAGAWSLFHLILPSPILGTWLALDTVYVRAIHLSFAICLVFLSYPALKKPRMKKLGVWIETKWPRFHGILGIVLGFLGEKKRIPLIDLMLAGLAAFAAGYYALDYMGIATRPGIPLQRDIVLGVTLIVLLLEAARRALGPALPIVAIVFIGYATYAEQAPTLLAFKAVSLNKLVNQLSLSTEGIYGVPLYVSASTVFLFVLFGAMLERTGGGAYFVKLAFSLLGTFRGGPAKAAVLASGLTGMISGSSIANVVTTGTFTIPLMKRAGYPATKAGAIEVAASTNGQLMPPIMGAAAFIIAEYCSLSYFEVVRAAFIPAIISYLALIYITHLEAMKLDLKGMKRVDLPPLGETFRSGIHYLIPLFFLLYLLVVKQYSPELSAFWSILVLGVTVTIHECVLSTLAGKGLGRALRHSGQLMGSSLVMGGRTMMTIGVAVAAAGIIVGIVNLGFGQRITAVVDYFANGNIYAILMMTAIASLILGMGLPTTANYIVMASLTATVIINLSSDAGIVVPLIAAHLFCFYFGILADDTPPVGLAAYAASAISKADPIRTGLQGFTYDLRTAILPFMFFFNTDLLLWGVTAWWEIAAIFVTGLLGMLAFASLTQGWLLVKTRKYEAVLLLVSTLFLLQPLILYRLFPMDALMALENKWIWRCFGMSLYGLVIILQWSRRPRSTEVRT